jgi:hypothetical protein
MECGFPFWVYTKEEYAVWTERLEPVPGRIYSLVVPNSGGILAKGADSTKPIKARLYGKKTDIVFTGSGLVEIPPPPFKKVALPPTNIVKQQMKSSVIVSTLVSGTAGVPDLYTSKPIVTPDLFSTWVNFALELVPIETKQQIFLGGELLFAMAILVISAPGWSSPYVPDFPDDYAGNVVTAQGGDCEDKVYYSKAAFDSIKKFPFKPNSAIDAVILSEINKISSFEAVQGIAHGKGHAWGVITNPKGRWIVECTQPFIPNEPSIIKPRTTPAGKDQIYPPAYLNIATYESVSVVVSATMTVLITRHGKVGVSINDFLANKYDTHPIAGMSHYPFNAFPRPAG